jgi:hypothetical protein
LNLKLTLVLCYTVSGGPSALLSRPGTNYTERSCSKRATIDEINKRNDSSASFFAGEGGFGGLSDIGVMSDFMPADSPVNTGIVRFPSATAADVNSGNNRFPSFGSFGGDSIDRLPAKNNPPIRIPSSKTLCQLFIAISFAHCYLF